MDKLCNRHIYMCGLSGMKGGTRGKKGGREGTFSNLFYIIGYVDTEQQD